MNMINVMGSQNGIVLYNGDVVTCYPGSNQTDKGKLQLEFNMARFVTRLSSKNFCVTNPSFVITTRQSTVTGIEQLVVSSGQASINGMDLIITDSIAVNPPESTGTYHLVLRLQRSDDNGNGNVLGDLTIGVQTIFQGVCLAYYDDKPDPVDPDFLYLARVTWDGEHFTSIIEDEDKYGRIWAEDILCKLNDPKHPSIRRLLLQDFIYNIPDWYVSKEGDVEFGAIEFLPGRQNGTYTSADYGTGKYGIKAQAVSDTSSEITIKAASDVDESYGPGKIKIVTTEGTNNSTVYTYLGNSLHYAHTHITDLGNSTTTLNRYVIGNYFVNSGTNLNIGSLELESNTLLSTANDTILRQIATIDPSTHSVSAIKLKERMSEDQWSLYKVNNNSNIYGLDAKWISNTDFELKLGLAPFRYLSNSKYLYLNKIPDGENTSTVDKFIIKPDVDITNDLTVGHNITATGDITAARVFNAVYNDICEFMEKEDYDEVIEPGDVVYFNDSGKVSKYHEGINSTAIAGVVSSEETYGYALGGDGLEDNQKVPVALKGRVWVKTDNTNFKPGDFVSVDSCGCVYKGDPHIYDIFVLGIATKKEENGKVWMMIK